MFTFCNYVLLVLYFRLCRCSLCALLLYVQSRSNLQLCRPCKKKIRDQISKKSLRKSKINISQKKSWKYCSLAVLKFDFTRNIFVLLNKEIPSFFPIDTNSSMIFEERRRQKIIAILKEQRQSLLKKRKYWNTKSSRGCPVFE